VTSNPTESGTDPGPKKWLPLIGAVVAIIVVIGLSRSSGTNGVENPDIGVPDGKSAGESQLLFIEDVGSPHESIGGNIAATCQGCHLPQYNDWVESPHGRALLSEEFISTFELVAAMGDSTYPCLACHSPQNVWMSNAENNGVLPDEAINCFACHTQTLHIGDQLLAEGIDSYEIGVEGIDFYEVGPQHPNLCANCHNPDTPLLQLLSTELTQAWSVNEALGNPYQEWLDSRFSQEGEDYKTCLDCHGQNGTGTLHRWPEDKAELVRSAYGEIEVLEIEAEDENGWRGGIRITNRGCGHMFPTGDPGRIITIELDVVDGSDILGEAVFSFGMIGDSDGNLVDTRLAPGEYHDMYIDIDNVPETAELKWTVSYRFDTAFQELMDMLGVESDVLIVEEKE